MDDGSSIDWITWGNSTERYSWLVQVIDWTSPPLREVHRNLSAGLPSPWRSTSCPNPHAQWPEKCVHKRKGIWSLDSDIRFAILTYSHHQDARKDLYKIYQNINHSKRKNWSPRELEDTCTWSCGHISEVRFKGFSGNNNRQKCRKFQLL